MGLSLLSALEIYGNRDRIVIDAGGPDKEGKYRGWITHGEYHRYRPIIDAGPYNTKDQALKAMQDLKSEVVEMGDKGELTKSLMREE